MIRMPRSVCGALALTLWGAALAHAEEAPACLPADVSLRVQFAEPKQLAKALAEVGKPRRGAAKREVLARLFREAGCASVEDQGASELPEPNLVCRIPGRTSSTIVIGVSPQVDGWPAAALLPELARIVLAEPREHSYVFAAFSRSALLTPGGARSFRESLGEHEPPAVFVHFGLLGAEAPIIGADTSDEQRCILKSVARALGIELKALRDWERVYYPCGAFFATTCTGLSDRRDLDTFVFSRTGSAVAGVYGVKEELSLGYGKRGAPHFDPATFVQAYRVLSAYLAVLDQALVSNAPASASAAEPAPTL